MGQPIFQVGGGGSRKCSHSLTWKPFQTEGRRRLFNMLILYINIRCISLPSKFWFFFSKFREEIDARLKSAGTHGFASFDSLLEDLPGWKRNMINFSQDNWYPGWDLNPDIPECSTHSTATFRLQDTVSPLRRPDAGNSYVPHTEAWSNFNAVSGFLNNWGIWWKNVAYLYGRI
jgi:hypothetical protein